MCFGYSRHKITGQNILKSELCYSVLSVILVINIDPDYIILYYIFKRFFLYFTTSFRHKMDFVNVSFLPLEGNAS